MLTTVGTERVPLEDLEPFPGNARRGNVELILDSLRANGQYKPLTVRRKDGTFTILAGNHTFLGLLRHEEDGRDACADWELSNDRPCQLCIAVDKDDPTALAHLIECDDATARRINVVDNKASDEGDYDQQALDAILATFDGDLVGTGYSASEADLFAATPAVPEAPPSLDDLAEQYGEPQETDLWPVIRVRVPPAVRDDFMELTKDCEDPSDDSVRFMALVQRVRNAA
ncbi:ParB/RepB/Spo0J family partition protein [Streptomyces sp. NPDC017936]|uniref:ParB/RepB/Spo0J family partition protein n=1 Tax=Streptomyces sp. NPDC017936 TaxID=3365016 RepID=UPI00379AC1F1